MGLSIAPVIRYLIVCDDLEMSGEYGRRVTIHGLLTSIIAVDASPFPLLYRELCVFVAAANGCGAGLAKIVCEFEETGEAIFETTPRAIDFGSRRLDVVGIPFRIRNCIFPKGGIYSIQFVYNGSVLERCSIRVRSEESERPAR